MAIWLRTQLIWICVAAYVFGACVRAQSVSDYAVRVSAEVRTNPTVISLSWPQDLNATDYTVYRKLRDATAWGNGVSLPGNATNYLDTNVIAGGTYEFLLGKNTANGYGEGCIYSGITSPLVESRGKLILVVDSTFSNNLSN